MGQRRTARQRALQIIYSIEFTGYSLTDATLLFRGLRDELEQNPKPLDQFTFDLAEKFLENRKEIDGKLEGALINWKFERLSSIDRIILQLAATELLFFDDIPPRVTINEFIEVAKNYGDNDSPQFVNGVLDRIARMESFDMKNKQTKVRVEKEAS